MTVVGFEWDVIPGERIGPLRLGMTEEELQTAWRSVPGWAKCEPEMRTAIPSQICPDFDADGRCKQIAIRLDMPAPITLLGVDIREDGIEAQFAKVGKPVFSYGSMDIAEAGIGATKWDHSDHSFVTLEVLWPSSGK